MSFAVLLLAEGTGNGFLHTEDESSVLMRVSITVTVTAWQWGRVSEGAVQTAEIVERSFHVLRNYPSDCK